MEKWLVLIVVIMIIDSDQRLKDPYICPVVLYLTKAPPNAPYSLTNASKLPLCLAMHSLPCTQLNSIVQVLAWCTLNMHEQLALHFHS